LNNWTGDLHAHLQNEEKAEYKRLIAKV
jgi:hypothetical protein